VGRLIAKRPIKLFERLLDTDVKADLLTLFHNNASLSETPEGLAKKVRRDPVEVQRSLEDLVELGILKKVEVYSFELDRDKEIQDAISKQLALGEIVAPERVVGPPGTNARQVPKIRTGVEIIDKLLPDGLPSACTIVLLSDSGAGEENILAHMVGREIQSGKAVVYIALDNFPPNIRQTVHAHVIQGSVDWSSLVFVDCYSRTVGVESDEPHVVDPENLSAISVAISDVMSRSEVSLIVVDSLNTLIRKRGGHSAIEFLRVLVARTRQAKCLCLVIMNRKAFHPAIVASAQDVVDGVIELKVDEDEQGIALSIRILKMGRAKHSTAWERYKIDDGELVSAYTDRP
jgi:KaiC/GvpD/RAD55 family RecA-like ATPase